MSSQGEARVLKHPLGSRLFHWALVLGFLPAAITGFVLFLKPGGEDFVNIAARIHIVGASILSVSAVLYTLMCFDRIVIFTRRIFSWNANDAAWFKVLGGYPQKMFLGKKVDVPPMGKINSGQKLFCICLLLGGILLIVTGWVLYAFIPVAPKSFTYGAANIHLAIGLFLGLFVCAHIFLGVYNWGEFKAMFGDGTQPINEARENNPLWVEHEIEPVKSG